MLTIAHRLNTVMDVDRIIVMDNGHIAEIGQPFILLSQREGYLSSLVERTGFTTATVLRNMAEESYRNKFR